MIILNTNSKVQQIFDIFIQIMHFKQQKRFRFVTFSAERGKDKTIYVMPIKLRGLMSKKVIAL